MPDSKSHLDRVRREFARQSETFDAHAVKADLSVEDRFHRVLGDRPAGATLDAGVNLRIESGKIGFFDRWRLVAADKPPA